jgi:hypothetical protein
MKHKSSKRQPNLKKRIEKACEGLVYISETDSPIEVFFKDDIKEPTAKYLLKSLERADETATESSNPEDFFKRLTQAREWHTEEQTKTVSRFKKLRQVLERDLDDIRVIRIGRIRIEIYVIGKSKNGEVAGIKTFSVET